MSVRRRNPQPVACKCWCFTYNNYPIDAIDQIKQNLSNESSYIIIGKEKCPSTKTPHLQGYVYLKRRLRFSQIKTRFDLQVHLEPARGSIRHNIVYCLKSGDYVQIGVPPIQFDNLKTSKKTPKEIAERFIDIARSGQGLQQFKLEFPHIWLKHGKRMLENHYLAEPPVPRDDVRVLWIYGPTGKGKTKYAHNKYPDAYIKCPTTKWWCGYAMEKEVIIDEFCTSAVDIALWLTWFQPYKCNVEFKGGHMPLCANRFIITSNYTPDMLYAMTTSHGAFMRRVKVLDLNQGTYALDDYLDKEFIPKLPIEWL